MSGFDAMLAAMFAETHPTRVVDELEDGTYPPRPGLPETVLFRGKNPPGDAIEGDWWVQP